MCSLYRAVKLASILQANALWGPNVEFVIAGRGGDENYGYALNDSSVSCPCWNEPYRLILGELTF
jgi:hypothetical protein